MNAANYERDKYLSEFSIKTLEDRYLVGEETSPQDAFARAARTFADDDNHAQRLYDYASKLWFMPLLQFFQMEEPEDYQLVVF